MYSLRNSSQPRHNCLARSQCMWFFSFFVIILVSVALTSSVKAKGKGKFAGFTEGSHRPRRLLPQLPPHPDEAFILEFITDGAEGVSKMEPIVKEMEKKFKIKIRKINLSRSPDAMAIFDFVGGNEGGNVPFFYNRRTAQAICGTTDVENLENLIMSEKTEFFAPLEPEAANDYDPENQLSTGFRGFLQHKVGNFAKRAMTDFLGRAKENSKQDS